MDSDGFKTGFQHMVDRSGSLCCVLCILVGDLAFQRLECPVRQGLGYIPGHNERLCELPVHGKEMDVFRIYRFHMDDLLAHGCQHHVGGSFP